MNILPMFFKLIVFFLMTFSLQVAYAYTFMTYKWPSPSATIYVDITGDDSWNGAFEGAMADWKSAGFTFKVIRSYSNPCAQNGISGVDFSTTFCGRAFGGVVAITTLWGDTQTLKASEADIVFDSGSGSGSLIDWALYSGPRSSAPRLNAIDFRRIALHELGHASGLNHEDDVPAIMSTFLGDIETLQADDVNGVKALYYKTKLLRSQSTKDGWALESTETSSKGSKADSVGTTLIVGDSAKNQEYRSVLHFDTASLPDNAVITKATLTLNQQSLKGDVTLLGKLLVDLKQNYFGASAVFGFNDFHATAGKKSVGIFKASGSTYSAVLNASGKSNISKTASTQFRIHFAKDDNNNKSADFLKFYSGNALSSSSRPSLTIEYYVK